MGVGYVPVAPGTFGSVVGLLIWYVLPVSLPAQGAAIAAVVVVGSWSGTIAERQFGRVDPGYVVIDEVAGMLVTLFLVPVSWIGLIVAFLLFRLFDIVKPYPAKRLERLRGGLGIVADDIMAGVYANLALRLCIWSFGHLVIRSSL